jgi:hypothetical protein
MSELQGFYPELVRKGIVFGLNLAPLVQRFWQLKAMRAEGRSPQVTWRCSSVKGGTSGRARRYSIVLTIGEASIEEPIEVLLHELVHCSCPVREHHGELFIRRLIACAREAFGLDLDTAKLLEMPIEGASKRAYAVDKVILRAMEAAKIGERLRAEPELVFVPAEPETEEQIEAKRVKAREKKILSRRAHCEEMLATWEQRATRARKLVSKWRKRVRYYETRELRAAKSRS